MIDVPVFIGAPSVSSRAVFTSTQDAADFYKAEASDPDPVEVLTFSIQINPGWLSIDPNSGLLTGRSADRRVGIEYGSSRVADH